jgi:hypothetical protein
VGVGVVAGCAAAIQRNDASVTSVALRPSRMDPSRMDVPSLCGRSMGSALLRNTSVISLTLDVAMLLGTDSGTPIETDDFASLVNYVATSAALHTVVCETSCVLEPTHESIGLIFAEQVLHAVASNTNIRALRFRTLVADGPEQMIVLLNHTSSLKELDLDISGSVLLRDSRSTRFRAFLPSIMWPLVGEWMRRVAYLIYVLSNRLLR